MSYSREKPKDIKYKQGVPFYKLVAGAVSDGLIGGFNLVGIGVVTPIKWILTLLKSCSIDFLVWIFDMLLVAQEHLLNLQRLKQKDPGGAVNIYNKKYEKKYEKDGGGLKGWLVGIYSIVSFWFILHANDILTISAVGDKLDFGGMFMVGMLILVIFPFFLIEDVHDRFRRENRHALKTGPRSKFQDYG